MTALFFFPKGSSVPILSLASWPSAKELELDDSQYRAIQMALTKEFAVIQGPPGTGKTYIGLKVGENLRIGQCVKDIPYVVIQASCELICSYKSYEGGIV